MALLLNGSLAAQRRVASLDAQRGTSNNPFTSAVAVNAGRPVFQSRCASCHGFDGTWNRGPDLTTGRVS